MSFAELGCTHKPLGEYFLDEFKSELGKVPLEDDKLENINSAWSAIFLDGTNEIIEIDKKVMELIYQHASNDI